jgi:hypothetical protein
VGISALSRSTVNLISAVLDIILLVSLASWFFLGF